MGGTKEVDCIVTSAYSNIYDSGDASTEILVRLKGGSFFRVDFYCIFGRFEEITPISKSKILGRLEPHRPHC